MVNRVYIKNMALLFAAMAITKIVGAVFKIPLANILGGTGMGYFSTAYSIYSPVFAVTAAGVPTVLMRLTAQNRALKRNMNACRIKKTALFLFSAIGVMGTVFIWAFADYFAANVACSEQSRYSIIVIAPAVYFCCVASVFRGYYEGMSNVLPSSVANVTEAVSRAVAGLLLSYGVLGTAKYCFDNGIAFMGGHYNSYDEAYSAALPWAAAAAVLAVTISEVCGLIALLIHDKKCGKTVSHTDYEPLDRRRDIIAELLKNLAPVAAFALVMNCFSFIDLLSVTRTISRSVGKYPDFFAREFRSVFEAGIEATELGNFMYGSYTGIAMSLFMLIPSFAGMAEKTTIPEITAAWERRENEKLTEKVQLLIRMCILIGSPACLGAAALAEPILSMLYPSRVAEVTVCINSFVVLCCGGLFMIITSAMSGVFQAIGKAHVPLIVMAVAAVVKGALNPLLVSLPEMNIAGAALATAISYAVAALLSVTICMKYVKGLRILRVAFVPLISGIACALTAKGVFAWSSVLIEHPLRTILAVLSGGIVYVILLIIATFFRTSLIRKQRKQKKTRKGLEKTLKIG